MKLFATDLDGTLLDRQDGIHPRDLEAITRARAAGVLVTIATGRLTSRTHPIARRLGLDVPLVCADGGVLACPTSERVLARRPVPHALADRALALFAEQELSSFVFTHDAIHSCERGRVHHPFVRGWSHAITAHEELRSAAPFHGEQESAIMVTGIGERAAVERVEAALAPVQAELDLITFDIADARVIRLMARGASKGTLLLELAAQLGIDRRDVAVIGDWYNDLSMFAVAGRSFAMPSAPDDIKAAATDVLEPSAHEQGPIATALARWLGTQA